MGLSDCCHNNSSSSVSAMTFKYTLENYPNFLPLFGLFTAGQDKLIKDVHTLLDRDVLHYQYVESIVFMLQSFCSQH